MRKQKRDAVTKHVHNLGRIFPRLAAYVEAYGPLDAYAALHDLERSAHALAEDQCNRPLNEGYVERMEASILGVLDNLIGFKTARVPVFCNGDPRGYALKIQPANIDKADPERNLPRDWGGYGIIAPDFED